MFFNFLKKPKPPKIEFRCFERHFNVIPEPFPSRKFLPHWYKSLKPKITNDGSFEDKLMREGFQLSKSHRGEQCTMMRSSTIKRCAPFLDSMTAGWILPLAADVWVKSNFDCSRLSWNEGKFKDVLGDRLIEEHTPRQLNEDSHPMWPKWPFKWLNYWSIKVPKGWSVLFIDPINRKNKYFECISGLVDCDGYEEFINFPFFWLKPDWEGIIPQGTPLVQLIPIHRDSFEITSEMRIFKPEEVEHLELTRRKHHAHESLYRDSIWIKNKGKK